MIVLCDASPLIFLAKLNRLALIRLATLVSKHRLRISVMLYQRFLAEFQPRDDHRGDCP